MRKLLLAICTAGILLGGCTEYEEPPLPVAPVDKVDETMTAVSFDISATPQQNNATTRAVDENALSNLQLLLVGTNGARYYYDLGGRRSFVASIRRGVYTVYASSGASIKYGSSDEAIINSLDASYNEGDASLKMSYKGSADFSSGGANNYSMKLVRTVAKMRFNVKTASNITVKNITLCHAATGTKLFPQTNQGNGFADRVLGVPGGGSFTVYMAENLAGTVSSITNQKQRTRANAPANATYLLIEGEVSEPGIVDWIVSKRSFESVVYLGSNTTSDFNVRRNNDYRIDINIASDLSNDYRIEVSRAGYEVCDRWTPDRKFLLWESVPHTLFFNGPTNETVSYKCVFEGHTPGKLKINGKDPVNNAVSGTIAGGKESKMDVVINEALYTPENHRVKYTLTFTYQDGTTTEYKDELRFANRTTVQTLPGKNVPIPSVQTAIITATSDESIVPDGSFTYTVYHAKRTLRLTATPLPGYTFKGWYSDAYLKQPISTSPTVTISVPVKWYFTVFARIDAE